MAPLPSVERVLDDVKSVSDMSSRLQSISRGFVGKPYTVNPLVGSADAPEVFTLSLDGFDCVTYMETVVAMAGARTSKDVVSRLKRIRYNKGEVDWRRRNHYMTDWIRNNMRAGLVRLLPIDRTVRKE